MKKVYTDEYWELVRQRLMGDTKTTSTMKKMITKGPMSLKGLKFNIPLFCANGQYYLCDEVKETTSGTNVDHKNYTLYFSWIPTSYNVPEKVEVEIYIPNNSPNTLVQMFEITDTGKKLNLIKNSVMKSKLNSLSSIREIFQLTALKM